jgi:hypothetical protein
MKNEKCGRHTDWTDWADFMQGTARRAVGAASRCTTVNCRYNPDRGCLSIENHLYTHIQPR